MTTAARLGPRWPAARPVVLLLVFVAAVAPATAGDPPTLPRPGLERFEPSVRRQLDELYTAATESGDRTASAAAFGLLGETYLAYELAEEAEAALALAADADPSEPRWPYLRALAALARGDREAAAGHFQRVLALRPGHLPTLLRDAELLLDLGRLGNAEARYDEVAAALGDQDLPGIRASLHFGRGRLAALAGRQQEAVAEFRRALELQPQADAIYYHLGRSLHLAGDLDAARRAVARRGDTQPAFRDAWATAMKRRAEGPQADLLRALRALKEDRLGDAEAALVRVLEQRPDDAEALAGLGRVRQRQGQSPVAEMFYRRSLAAGAEGETDDVSVLLNLGTLLAERGSAEALDLFRRAVAADPGSAAAHYNLGLELLRRGYEPAGEAELRRALELDPDDAGALETLARTLAARQDFAAAAEPYRRLVAAAPERADIRFVLALVLTLGGRCADARPELETALERFRPDATPAEPAADALQGLLARVLAACPDDATRDGTRAMELAHDLYRRSPGVESTRTLAMALAETGRTAEAAELLRRALEAATRAGASSALPVLQSELDAYQAGRPVRSPW